ncbi:SAVED domain-containing protein [Clostridium tagluense]|uniref:SAVED domain-containing protein n=1 Tax=Clostridium tagluense TaxID=360422 RepID=UPI001CF2B103|nr:SAVED domain-containing protein [Clostridium tagluense]MCB2312910.1 SAVED domain-containing protein [Clostridium tagluense]MCB2317676.1 SAVED domain-containing protein [Clostridium tagluense]MCB2322490.1 SAVED domain-containing protein [Clostridium tagluense]MCB2327492.1 SAVED domain-containing protein [Clostridium tagluense]MCB2332211.1 SAVED domain-containing protein [Clostridium tagluense]
MENHIVLNENIIDSKEIKKYIEKTSANSAIKGYLYQFLTTVRLWVELHGKYINSNEEYKIYCEYEDDIKIETFDKVKYIQVKAYKDEFSLTSQAVTKTIFNFFLLYLSNNEKANMFIIESNSCATGKAELLNKWSSETLTEDDVYEIVRILKPYIDKFYKEKFDKNISKDIELYNFIKLIKINFKKESIDKCTANEKDRILIDIKNITMKINKEILLAKLLQEVIEKSSSKNKCDRVLDKECLENILRKGEEMIKNSTDKEYIDVIRDIEKKLSARIMESKEEIIEKLENTLIYKSSEDEEEKIKANCTKILIRSRKKIMNLEFELNLSEFFISNNSSSDDYRKIKNLHFWNNELINKIDKLFVELDDNIIKKEHLLIDMQYTHSSIAFYTAYNNHRRFGRKMYPIESGKIYYNRCYKDIKDKWNVEFTPLESGKDIAVIINSTENKKNVYSDIKTFIDHRESDIKELISFTLENNSQHSITTENVWELSNQVKEILDKYNNRIHLFFICPNILTFIIGTKLDKKLDLVLYEHSNYQHDGTEENLYTESINIKKIKGNKERNLICNTTK